MWSSQKAEEFCSGMVLLKLIIEKRAKSILGSEPIYSSVVQVFLNCSVSIHIMACFLP